MKHFLPSAKLVFTLLTLVSISDVQAQDPVLCDSEVCTISGFGNDMRAFWIPGLPGPGSIKYNSTETSLTMDSYSDGTAHIYGDVYNQTHSEYGWHVEFWITDKSDWDEWSSLGRYWKGDSDIVGDLYETWDYYIVDETKVNQLTGLGPYEGDVINLTHKPSNYYYGFQMGEAANDQDDAYGFSCWFFYSGQVLGQEVNGQCDINGEGTCENELVMECLADVSLDCGEELILANTGIPNLNCEGFTLTYTDTYSSDCPVVITRVWQAMNSQGELAACSQQITIPDLFAPDILDDIENIVVTEFPEIDVSAISLADDCSEVTIEATTTELVNDGENFCQFRTQTPGGWGAITNGNNPGAYRDANFTSVFPEGLTVGCLNSIHLLSSQDIQSFLPSGGSPSALSQSLINPTGYGNSLAGHLVALTLSLGFDEAIEDFGPSSQLLKNQIIGSGNFVGWTIEEVVSLANEVIGGCSEEYTASEMVEVLSLINENYVDGDQNNGNVDCLSSEGDCAQVFFVEYIATDECGNSSSQSQIIFVQADGGYSSEDCPEDIIAECGSIPDAPEVLFTSECGESLVGILAEEIVEGECEGSYSIIRTWQVTTNDGEVLECSQTVSVVDNTPPIFTNLPEDITVECGNVPDPEIEAEDDCALQSIEVELTETTLSGNCFPTILRTFIAEDDCGNVASHTQYITVVDTQDPVVTNQPQDVDLNCGDDIPEYYPVAVDNCSDLLTVTYHENHEELACGSQVEQVWIVIDACNNSTQVNRVVTFTDSTPPLLNGTLEDITLECGIEFPQPEFYDDCDGDLTISTTPSELTGCGAPVDVVYTVTDNCGNTSEFYQTITVIDTEAPVITLESTSLEVLCEELTNMPDPEIADCNEVSVTSTDVLSDFNEGCATVIRTWVAEDICGNVSSVQQEIMLLDDEAPVFLTEPEDMTMSCANYESPELPVVTDNCDDDVEVTFSATEVIVECGVEITRVWVATDDCGNTAQIEQVVTLTDLEAPVITGESVISAECGEELENLVTVTDDCAEFIELNFTDQINSENNCQSSITRTYVATDPCGNTAEFIQQITFTDSEAPEISPTPEVRLQCASELANLELATAVDNCGNASLDFQDEVTENGCETVINRVYTATDECGNSKDQTQVIIISDTEAPVFTTELSDIVLSCGASTPELPEVAAADNCSEVTITLAEETNSDLCPNSALITRTWTATDECNNSATLVQTISIEDNEAPVFDQTVEDITGECGMNYPLPEITATDNCAVDVEVSFNQSTASGGCPNIFRTWTATDACGNTATLVQTIFIEDTEPPLMSGIEFSITATCENIPDLPVPTVTDNCDENVDVTVTESLTGTGCEQILIRMWIATDDCGNTTIATQSINLIDEAPPVFINPIADNAVECDDLDALPLPEVTDNCGGDISLTFTDEETGSGCESLIIRTYTASDLCGNSSSFTQNITVIDLSSPLFVGIPPGTFVDCNNIPDPVTPTVIDNCNNDDVLVEFTEEIQGSGCSYTIIRSWTATDICGNTSNASRFIFVQDVSAPVFLGAPQDVVLNCNAEIPETTPVAAVDACSGQVDVDFSETTEVDECGTLVTRTWTAEDDCGNSSTHTQLIEITDLEAPQLSAIPEDVTVNCDGLPVVALVTATDNCSENPQVNYREELVTGICPYQIHRIWTAMDACGNVAEGVQVVNVIDNEAPLFLETPEDVTLTCSELTEAEVLVATDGCVSEPQVFIEEEYSGTDCERVLTRTWTAVDHCGNATEHVQQITLIDTEAPTVAPYESDLYIECTDRPDFVLPEFTDDCNEISITSSDQSFYGACDQTYEWVRTWVATDLCGNSIEATQTIHVIDTSAPILSVEDSEITVTCNEVPDLEPVAVFSECEDTEVQFIEEVEFLEELDNDCSLGNASSLLGDVAIWLPNLSGDGDDFVFGEEPGTFSRDAATGDVLISGQVYNVNNPAQSWILDLRLYDSQQWEEWSANGGSYKDEMNLAGDNYLNWEYLKLSSESTLTGAGEYAGSELFLTHTPVDYTYGFQMGQGANNRNGNYGISGWFFYQGMLDGNFVFGNGDLIADLQCCPDQDIVRTWTATDCSGNTTTVTQIIHVRANLELSPLALYELPEEAFFNVTNSTGEEFVLTFDSGEDLEKTLLITDLSGRTMHSETFNGLEKHTEYTRKVPKSDFQNGMYMFYLQGKTASASDKELKLD
ncbi:MAG: hypothetical protein AB8B53_10375 [Flavobacteriales bacterium]